MSLFSDMDGISFFALYVSTMQREYLVEVYVDKPYCAVRCKFKVGMGSLFATSFSRRLGLRIERIGRVLRKH